MARQLLRFGIVGALATLVHLIIGFLLIKSGWAAPKANFAAFALAFFVSFGGHLGYSFADQAAPLSAALWRFAIVSGVGFCVNQAALIWLLHHSTLPETGAIVLSTLGAATVTFCLSKAWAFRGRKMMHTLRPQARFNRNALLTTKMLDSAIAAAAKAGDNSTPNTGNSTPAATGISKTL